MVSFCASYGIYPDLHLALMLLLLLLLPLLHIASGREISRIKKAYKLCRARKA